MVRNFRETHPETDDALFEDDFCDSYGDPYWDAEDIFPPPPDQDEEPDLSWWPWTQIDQEELERQMAANEIELGKEEDALVKSWGGNSPRRRSLRRCLPSRNGIRGLSVRKDSKMRHSPSWKSHKTLRQYLRQMRRLNYSY